MPDKHISLTSAFISPCFHVPNSLCGDNEVAIITAVAELFTRAGNTCSTVLRLNIDRNELQGKQNYDSHLASVNPLKCFAKYEDERRQRC